MMEKDGVNKVDAKIREGFRENGCQAVRVTPVRTAGVSAAYKRRGGDGARTVSVRIKGEGQTPDDARESPPVSVSKVRPKRRKTYSLNAGPPRDAAKKTVRAAAVIRPSKRIAEEEKRAGNPPEQGDGRNGTAAPERRAAVPVWIYAAALTVIAAAVLILSFPEKNVPAVKAGEPEGQTETVTDAPPPEEEPVVIDRILSIDVLTKEVYLPIGGTRRIETALEYTGDVNTEISWRSSDEAIASVSADGVVTGHGSGTVLIVASADNGMSDTAEVVATDCIIEPSYEYKEFIPANLYTEDEAVLMDKILQSRIDDAGGPGTRGAVVAAARFLTLEMPYMIPYFYENGRMDASPGRPVCDGEGRYYHTGLYLSESKYENIEASVAGPAYWGAPLMNFQNEGYFTSGLRYPNGLSCSGFVAWVMINGGIDTGDVGAGNFPEVEDEFYDIGEHSELTVELLKSGEVRPGDLIGKDGHIAVVAGIDDTYIWIAESYFRGVQVVRFTVDRGVLDCEEYDYIIDMSRMYYNGDGIFDGTWE